MSLIPREPAKLKEVMEDIASSAVDVQLRRLQTIREAMELDEMYYEQKGSERGMARVQSCLILLDERIKKLVG